MMFERLKFIASAWPSHTAVTVSLGVALVELPTDPMDDILKRADEALYRAKREEHNRVISNAA